MFYSCTSSRRRENFKIDADMTKQWKGEIME